MEQSQGIAIEDYPRAALILSLGQPYEEPAEHAVKAALEAASNHQCFAKKFFTATKVEGTLVMDVLTNMIDSMFFYKHHPTLLLQGDHKKRRYAMLFPEGLSCITATALIFCSLKRE